MKSRNMINLSPVIIFVCYLHCFSYCGTLPTSQQTEQTLVTTLLNSYNKNIRPDDQVSVDITAKLKQILTLDEKQQIMTSSLFISQTWFDDRLSWTPNATNGNITVVMLPVKSIWIPDTMILNSADPSGYFTVNDYSLASIYYDGQVYLILPALAIKTKCNVAVKNFPFDKQVCSINVTSWSQGSNRIVYTEKNDSIIDLSDYDEHPIWQLNGTDVVLIRAEDRAPFEDTYNAIISMQLYLKRKPLFFILNGIFACLILNCVTLLSYAVPFVVQINLCMTCFLTYSVYSLNFSNLFPQQSEYLMMITLFFLLSISWTFISMIWFIMHFYFTSTAEMPTVLYVFCGKLQRILCYCFPPEKKDDKINKKTGVVPDDGEIQNFSEVKNTTATFISKRRVAARNDNVETTKSNSTDVTSTEIKSSIPMTETMKIATPKCDFCNRCESCQTEFNKDKAKGKFKKDIEARCSALNYFVFLCGFLFIFVSNMAVWISMSI
ncbi:unnamed protein product [Rotaria magnacalcarata]|uniref:Neurotransmitter-gated ion-channel ligand-binding domain-containing protein n=2 Tax=Rotaria magnacalcarata TaxID=392030 RepID=A0A816MP39_9BILA|nr:unnamed protein product [Rotaria magnacalcarata]